MFNTCKIGIHSWVYDRMAMLVDLKQVYLNDPVYEGAPVFKFKSNKIPIRIKHCDRCKKIKVFVPKNTKTKMYD